MQDLDKFKNEMNLSGKNVYVGNRYVPKIMGEWDNSQIYEPLSIVQYQGNSFTTRQYVPVGVEITNEEFWVSTGNYNAQVEQYRQNVRDLEDEVNTYAGEVRNARNGESTLSGRLEKDQQEVNTQLAQTASELDVLGNNKADKVLVNQIEHSNASKPLNIVNYLRDTQNVHPSVEYFPNGWNGYKYWVAYTPYPFSNATYENPSIAVSNDQVIWTTPDGVTNPLNYPPAGFSYNSDVDLVYRDDINTLEMIFRQVIDYNTTFNKKILKITTTDGKNWSEPKSVFELEKNEDMLSPSVMFEDGKYKLWYVEDSVIKYIESADKGVSWTNPITLAIDYGNLRPWHFDVKHTDLGYEFIFGTHQSVNEQYALWHVVQKGNTFTKPQMIMQPPANKYAIDNQQLYRPSFYKENGVYYIYYSYKNDNNVWGIALVHGRNILNLSEINQDYYTPHRHRRISAGFTMENYDVRQIDVIEINATVTKTTTLKNLKGGYLGKRILIYVLGSDGELEIIGNQGILLPNFSESYTVNYQERMAIELVCTSTNGDQWRAVVNEKMPTKVTIDSNTNLTDYNVKGVDLLWLNLNNGPITIKNLIGGHIGKSIKVIPWGMTHSATFTGNQGILIPNLADSYTLNFAENSHVELYCINDAGTQWRLLS